MLADIVCVPFDTIIVPPPGNPLSMEDPTVALFRNFDRVRAWLLQLLRVVMMCCTGATSSSEGNRSWGALDSCVRRQLYDFLQVPAACRSKSAHTQLTHTHSASVVLLLRLSLCICDASSHCCQLDVCLHLIAFHCVSPPDCVPLRVST